MTPPTVNANYDPSMNDINFPADILKPSFFDFSIGPAVIFGGIDVVIGHEMTHGFDDEGSQYDDTGNLGEWQTPIRPAAGASTAPSRTSTNSAKPLLHQEPTHVPGQFLPGVVKSLQPFTSRGFPLPRLPIGFMQISPRAG